MQQDSATLGSKLVEYMRVHGYTQSDVAEKASVNQSTVSRFLRKPPQRATSANERLCNYAESVVSEVADKGNQSSARKSLEICWSRSEAHAQAVSKILDALAELCQHDRDEEVASG